MSRQRFIYPEIWHSEQVMGLTLGARLLWIGIFSTADDAGRRSASAASLKASIFPLDTIGPDTVRKWTRDVAESGLIRVYRDSQGALVLDVPNWSKYQNPKYKKPSKLEEFRAKSALTPDQIFPDPAPDPGRISPECGQVGDRPGTDMDHTATDSAPIGPCGVEGCGVVVEGCGVEGKGIETPPLTGDVSVTEHPSEPGPAPEPEAHDEQPADTPTATEGFASTEAVNDDDPTKAKAFDIVATWNGESFANIGDLRGKMTSADPVTLLAHVHEIDTSKRIKRKLAALFTRLKAGDAMEPSDPAKRWASEQINPKGEGGPPQSIASVLPAEKPRQSVTECFELLTSGWPDDEKNEQTARAIACTLLRLRPAFVIAHCRLINSDKPAGGNWRALRTRLGTTEAVDPEILDIAKRDVESMLSSP